MVSKTVLPNSTTVNIAQIRPQYLSCLKLGVNSKSKMLSLDFKAYK